MVIRGRPVVARGLSTLEAWAPTHRYDPKLQLNVDQNDRPVVETTAVPTQTMTKREGDPPEAPDLIAAVPTHTFTRQEGDRPESPDVWDMPSQGGESGDCAADDLSTGVVTF